ncbi:MAG: aminotransferase class I/II-fold pyridoxal phosphate-dependent enzyme [Desulfarculaceae bacterium]|nr:aminotransferase class I/II-fold pyridoxal phosphate-dependent enzyme [Desulfarculaceae bacterium]MCF8074205.1 aminotransferase class I/II-fold pyridoxal phosphate-dependent enzyme [Desulfarculaceae bacterium]MCF8102786.1 aminotransferase class I/II-fold pyridoxal phosphate-dependent enzyme [Desulfarculaceae bacterium]MCF8116359.1 aminotransferase class I/II-fold pyridoxal phosphate-dependent enzyme [Desulfarculaceae bacterium]
MKPVNDLTNQFGESVIRGMSRVCAAAGGINLAQGFPDWDTPEEVKEAAIKAIRDGYNQYAVTWGTPNLRNAIAERCAVYNRFSVDPEADITVTCGATEGMIAALKAIINPGDEIIIFEPFYENYGPDTLMSHATPRYVTLHAPDWSFDPDELAAAFNERTKAVVMNTPNNPTGKVFSRAELETIAELCLKWDAYFINDEIYEYILYDDAEHISPATLPGMKDLAITVNSMSKTFSATGWRVGWVIAPPAVTSAVRKVHDFLTVGAAHPLQEACAAGLKLPESYYQGLRGIYADCRERLYSALDQADFRPNKPGGAYYIITQVGHLMERYGCTDDTEFAYKLIELTGVATVPGSSFYSDPALGREQIRFCFCKKADTLDQAAQGLRKLS